MKLDEYIQDYTTSQQITLQQVLRLLPGEELGVVCLASFYKSRPRSLPNECVWILVRTPELGYFRQPVTNQVRSLELEYDTGHFYPMSCDGCVKPLQALCHLDGNVIQRLSRKHWSKYNASKTRIGLEGSVIVPLQWCLNDPILVCWENTLEKNYGVIDSMITKESANLCDHD
jgi:hypothetical protein